MATAKTQPPKIQSTRNYGLFKRSAENRALDIKQHKRLLKSMEKYGFLPVFPIICHRNGDAHLVVKDGQHRLALAEHMNLAVHYVVSDVDFDVAAINCTPTTWKPKDYAQKFAANGLQGYIDGVEFSERHGIPIGLAFSLLAGQVSFSNIAASFYEGRFKVKEKAWAESVASVYVPMVTLSRELRGARFLTACMRACRVAEFEPKRLLQNAGRCREKLLSYSTIDAYMGMLEETYNFGQRKLFGLKAAAEMAMRERNPGISATDKKKDAK